MTAEIVVSQWPRNSREVIIVKLTEYQGNPVCDVRTWYRSDDGLRPSRSGITLSTRHLSQLADALVKAAEVASNPYEVEPVPAEAVAPHSHADALDAQGNEGPGAA